MAADVLIVLAKAVLAMTWTLLLALFLTWVERKESAVMQDRIGANRASIFGLRLFGLFQPFADAIKMFFKEDFVPSFARKPLHWLAPAVSFFCVSVTMIAVPFGDAIRLFGRRIPLQVADLDAAVLFVLAMLGLGVYGILTGGWASANRFGLIGSLRGAAQLISYEVALGLSLVGLIMVFPSLRLSRIVEYQGGLLFGVLPKWGIFLQPLGFAVFFLAGLAETKRVPFDLPEGESEIIGFYTEYSGLKFGLFMFTDFLEVIVFAALAATLFFGGWQVPWLGDGGFVFPWGGRIAAAPWAVTVLRVLSFNLKVLFFCWLQILVRWTYPRLRYDQVMDLGWKVLVPAGAFNILATGLVLAVR
ncbi:MAG TPA: NADH-quinone oxidoreductase subunit H [Candidatus Aminicenantes bacterium]|nr:NADH-quinone oxidoreductase subunit H [Candidatus Aminicenantes bacterium]HRY66275.1 NADH-quinone oxidoreductase subunit H [Candidatus Aminicenantes bacterium]HRZ73205.1 NADH-quinone oxidoreductase subunit H [Candidatus Aminicenantes bacterium]